MYAADLVSSGACFEACHAIITFRMYIGGYIDRLYFTCQVFKPLGVGNLGEV